MGGLVPAQFSLANLQKPLQAGKMIVLGSKDKNICLGDPVSGVCYHVIGGHKGYTSSVSQFLTSVSGGTI